MKDIREDARQSLISLRVDPYEFYKKISIFLAGLRGYVHISLYVLRGFRARLASTVYTGALAIPT